MIAHLKGQLTYKSPEYTIVDVSGVGYQVFTPLSTYYALPDPGQTVSLRVHTRVREDELKLFGFLTEEEQTIFQKLITINKVGPKLALGILSGMSPADLISTIMNNDAARLSTIPGVGKKTAERLTLELKDKLADLALEMEHHPEAAPKQGFYDDALSALVNLGYKKPEAEKALKTIYNQNGKDASLEDLIKESLNIL
ncbi:MAG: Holliday junction branch migration protein RuvA [Nitrospina sp.]|jgi:Holliday junction DNA helicase RuvA|nr:Holliday junction branch migration protein RuvA [Nitrospina sp.]MBT3415992.1 Holliday junction branch migration protein RuvA [Nitrospina sp.]MBT3856053.1 Holliday junction branch migration protein RuvA [Nitrospina sp.]MBT4105676.1 Holliday junction branch migration protein RuvA [Nitrospina sp.]MBT4390719.1 Holliday junction branch migration protein RuvA [Nitrospina sp.]